jgi:fimbrial chaperone protein
MKTQNRPLSALAIRSCLSALVALTFGSALLPAWAATFSVTPVRIYMTPRDRAVAITLTNEGDTPVALQADINVWSQKPDGTDELVLTEDLILSPPIIKLAPKGRQVVRLALLKPADASRQLTYRLIVREVPEITAPKSGVVEVPIILALSMPVFITPPIAKREMDCRATRESASVIVSCSNTGTAYAQIREISLKRGADALAKFEGGVYILPGASKSVGIKPEIAISAGALAMQVTFDDGKSQEFPVNLP